MTEEQIRLVKESWDKVLPIINTVARLFYFRLFQLNPKLRDLFHVDIGDQGRKLMLTFNTAIEVLDNFDDLLPTLENLGRRHVAFGVEDKDYTTARIALIWALEHGLGEEFTFETKEAWLAIYDNMAKPMTQAAIQYREEMEDASVGNVSSR